ncbi:MAG: DUF2400 family protein [bacterium JZ-2024 1]
MIKRKDPEAFLYDVPGGNSLETAGMVLSYLAYGNTSAMTDAVGKLWTYIEPVLCDVDISLSFPEGFSWKYRFTRPSDLILLIDRIHQVQKKFGSLEECFRYAWQKENSLRFALGFMRKQLGEDIPFLADPFKGGACKRWMLFLRWMRRNDGIIDRGEWKIPPLNCLLVPLDTHLFSLGKKWGWLKRKRADWKAAEEFTRYLKKCDSEDPLRYEFSLYCWYAESREAGKGAPKSEEGYF